MKPLLAATLESSDIIHRLRFPVLASPKLDGIRVLVKDGVLLSRNLKPIRNKYVQSYLGSHEFNGLDGEIVVGNSSGPQVFRATSSGVMSEDGEPEFTFWVFDKFDEDKPFKDRLEKVKLVVEKANAFGLDKVKVLPQNVIGSVQSLNNFEEAMLNYGYEGVMLRDPEGMYKFGRSTMKEQILMKLKRFLQKEAVVIGFQERMHNANEAKINELGHTERSSHKDNMVGRGDLGALKVRMGKVEFTIGTGFDDLTRQEIWDNQEEYMGKIVTFKFFDYGGYDAPRFPVFHGFRDKDDV